MLMPDSREIIARVAANLKDGEPAPDVVAARIAELRAVLAARLDVVDCVIAGGYSRHTLIPPLRFASVDAIFVLGPRFFRPDGWTALLQQLKAVLAEVSASRVDLSRNGRAVRISLSSFAMDVIPGFYRQNGGYVIPDVARSRWLATDPIKHAAIWRQADQRQNGRLIPMLRMLRAWNRCQGSPFQSLHLEGLALRIFEKAAIGDALSALRHFFDKARPMVLAPTPDPAGYGGDLGDYLDDSEKMSAAVASIDAGHARIVNALLIEELGKPERAKSDWLAIFGRYAEASADEAV